MRYLLSAMMFTGALLRASIATAVPPKLLRVVPPGAPGVVWLDGHASPDDPGKPAGTGGLAAALLRHTRAAGLLHHLDATAGWIADAAALLPDLGRYPRAVVLFDARAAARADGGFELAALSAGLIIDTGTDHERIARHVQALLTLHTHSESAHLSRRRVNDHTVHTLHDMRLPDWAVIEWGSLEEWYVITVGAGTFERVAEALRRPLDPTEDWIAGAFGRCRGPAARWAWYIDFDGLRRRLAPVMSQTPRTVLEALGLGDVSRGLWTVGPDSRAVDAACLIQRGDRDRYIPITAGADTTRRLDRAIPPEAQSGAIIRARPAIRIPRVCRAYLAARSPGTRARLTARWRGLEAEAGVEATADLLMPLGEHIIIHDYPSHPLRLPVLRTVLVELTGGADAVRTSLDRLLGSLRDALERRDGGLVHLRRAEDGVWFVEYGLYGPALAVTDRWIVISYSPAAVRRNLDFLTTSLETTTAPTGSVR